MLQINVPNIEYYDERTNTFGRINGCTLNLEHSLLSISKWEAKWHKPYIESPNSPKSKAKTPEEQLDYIRCMCLDKNVDPLLFNFLPVEVVLKIKTYIDDPMTATWFSDRDNHQNPKEIVTSELIYYWMIALGIPFECQKWHLNRLMTLIRVCNLKQQPSKKMSKRDIMRRNQSLNAARRSRMGSKG